MSVRLLVSLLIALPCTAPMLLGQQARWPTADLENDDDDQA